MSRTFFTADTHFGDTAILQTESRPYKDAHEMDETLIANWNKNVAADDTVYILGDFGANGYEKDVLRRLFGTKYLIKGERDTKPNQYYRDAGFTEVYDHTILVNGFWLLSHKPIQVNPNTPYVNIFGHVHNSIMINDRSRHHYCVSCDRMLNDVVISFDKIRDYIRESRYGSI